MSLSFVYNIIVHGSFVSLFHRRILVLWPIVWTNLCAKNLPCSYPRGMMEALIISKRSRNGIRNRRLSRPTSINLMPMWRLNCLDRLNQCSNDFCFPILTIRVTIQRIMERLLCLIVFHIHLWPIWVNLCGQSVGFFAFSNTKSKFLLGKATF